MILETLNIQNIASLKGEHEISFKDITNVTNLFAITGDTGSGKSTILNAISLALYGNNYKSKLRPQDLVTLGEEYGQVQLTFILKNKRYKATWYCKIKNRHGEDLKSISPRNEIYEELNGSMDLLGSTKELKQEILGMSFDQFCKTVILNQGEFSKFILAGFDERKQILERFYSAEILSTINQIAKKRFDEVTRSIKDLELKQEGAHSQVTQDPQKLETSIKSLEDEEKDLTSKLSEYKYLKEKLNDFIIRLDYILNNDQRLKTIFSKLEEKTKELNQNKIAFNNINKKLTDFKDKYNSLIGPLREALDIETKINLLFSESNKTKDLLKKMVSFLNELTEKKELLLADIELLNKNEINTVLNFKLDIEELENYLKISNDAINKIKHLALLKNEDNTLSTVISDLNIRIENTKKKLSTLDDLQKEYKQEDIQKELENLQGRISKIQLTQEKFEIYEKDLDLEKKKKIDLKLKATELNIEFNTLSKSIKLLKEDIKFINDSIELHELKSSIIRCQNESLKGHTCVVCQGPYDETKSKIKLEDKSFEEIKNALSKKEIKKSELEALQKTFLQVETNLKAKQDEKYQTQLIIEKLKTNIEDSKLYLGAHNLKATITRRDDFLEINEKLKSTYKEKESLAKELSELEKTYQSQKEKLNSTLVNIKKLDQEILESKNKVNEIFYINSDNKINYLEEAIKIKKEINKHLSEIKILDAQISDAVVNKKRYDEKLSEDHETINNLKEERQNKTQEKNIKEKIETLTTTLENLTEEDKKTKERLNQVDVSIRELNSSKGSIEEQIQQSIIYLNSLKLEFQTKKQKIENLFKDESDYLVSIYNKVLGTNHYNSNVKPIIELSIEEVSKLDTEVTSALKSIRDKLSQERTLLDEYKKFFLRQEILQKELETLTEVKNKREVLYQLFRGDDFRNYVLSLIEEELIIATNKELEELCDGRYSIIQRHKNNRNFPDFYVIDKLKDSDYRKVSTLSGGETFMVSLACALALSDLSRGSSQIDSFFIDEGFGTLDEDSLDEAVEMLKRVESRGKVIGIISHVKRLTNRLGVNVFLDKNQFGNSKIELRYFD